MPDFDIIFTDYILPGMNGLKIAEILRRRFRVAFIIGMSSDDVERDFLSHGADAFIRKPFSIKDILQIIEKQKSRNP